MGTGEVVTGVEVAPTEGVLEVEVFGVEESVAVSVDEGSMEALVAEGNEEALVVEVDQTGKVLVVGGDQKEDVEAEAGEGTINLVVGTTEGILVRMGPLTGRRGQIMVDGRIVMDLRLGTRILVTRIGRAGAREMQIRSILAGTKEVEEIRAGVQQVELMIMDLRLGTRGMQIRSIQAGTKLEISRAGVQQVVEVTIIGTTMGHRRLQRLAGKNLQLKGPISRVVGGTRDLVQTLLLRTGVNQVLQTRVKHLVGKKQQMVRKK